jgi:hypothetical protein
MEFPGFVSIRFRGGHRTVQPSVSGAMLNRASPAFDTSCIAICLACSICGADAHLLLKKFLLWLLVLP